MWLLSAHLLATVLEGRICCIQMELIYQSLGKLGGNIIHKPPVFFMISKKTLLDLLERTIDNPQGWGDASTSQASGLYLFMNSFLFSFLVHIFNRILEKSSLFYMVLQNRNTDFSYVCQKISAFGNFLSDLQIKDITTKLYIFKLFITLCVCCLRGLQTARTLLSWIW